MYKKLKTNLYIEYISKNLVSKQQLILNTYEKYFSHLNMGVLYGEQSKKSYQNRLSNNELEQIKKIFTLSDLDEVVLEVEKPYFLNLFNMLTSLNNIKHIINEQFKCPETQLNYDNYKTKTARQKEKGEAFDKPFDILEAKLHSGIIDEYKEDDIIGSLIIKSLQNPLSKIFTPLEYQPVVENNKNFQKQFEKVNFTENDLYRGFACQLYWSYAHKNYSEYKEYVSKNNQEAKKYNPNKQNYQDYKKYIPLINKLNIENEIMEIFNTIFKNETIKQIRTSKKQPKILKLYDGIAIPTIKSIKRLEDDFYQLIINEIIPNDIKEEMDKLLKEDNSKFTFFDLCCIIRPTLY